MIRRIAVAIRKKSHSVNEPLMEVFTLHDCDNITNSYLSHYKQKKTNCSHNQNKKVPLRECMRHTAGHVSSTPSAFLSSGGGGTPSLDSGVARLWTGGYPIPGFISPSGPGRGTLRVWTDKQIETITFPHPSDAGGKNCTVWTSPKCLESNTFEFSQNNT